MWYLGCNRSRNKNKYDQRKLCKRASSIFKYYADNKFVTIPIKKITTKMLNDFLNDSITTFKFSRKEFNNMKTILNAVFQMALDKDILSVNPLLNTHTSIKFRSIQKKKDGSRLYLEKEMEILEDFLYQQETMEAYTILMDFQIGTRRMVKE